MVIDHPVYVFIALLKTENPNKYCDIVPFLGPFHTTCDDEHYTQGEWATRGTRGGGLRRLCAKRQTLQDGAALLVAPVWGTYVSAGEGDAHGRPGW